MTFREVCIALNCAKDIGGATVRKLCDFFKNLDGLDQADETQLMRVQGIGKVKAHQIYAALRSDNWKRELEFAEKSKVNLLTPADELYPLRLKEIPDPPSALYVAGNIMRMTSSCIAIVGTRAPTAYGAKVAFDFAENLAYSGYTIVSGLAEGIDTQAHRGALCAVGAPTIAVLGSSIDCLYPKCNSPLAEAITSNGGAIVSEFPFKRPANRLMFPQRNRIISGLSLGVVAVEAPDGSGTLITAECAADQGRTVMAVPGHITSLQSRGTNRLLRDGAAVVCSPQDVIDELSLFKQPFKSQMPPRIIDAYIPPTPKPPNPNLSPDEQKVYDAIPVDGILLDDLLTRCGLPPQNLNLILTRLSIRRLVSSDITGTITKL